MHLVVSAQTFGQTSCPRAGVASGGHVGAESSPAWVEVLWRGAGAPPGERSAGGTYERLAVAVILSATWRAALALLTMTPSARRSLASWTAVLTFPVLVHCTERVVVQPSGGTPPSATDDTLPSENPNADSGVDATTPATNHGESPGQPKDAGTDGAGTKDGSVGVDWQPPANFTGIGSSVAACNGAGLVAQYGPGEPTQRWDVRTVWIFGNDGPTGRGNKIFGYTRPLIEHSTLPLVGTAGEMQVRLSIDSPTPTLTPGAQYQGVLALSTWNAAEGKWSTVAGSMTGAALVFIDSFHADATAWGDGHFCAGKITGRVESLLGGATRLDFHFSAPLLAPSSFPK